MTPVPDLGETFRPNEARPARPPLLVADPGRGRHWADPVPADGLPSGRVGWRRRASRRAAEPGAMPRRCWPRPGHARCCPSTERAGSAGRACPGTGWTPAGLPGGRARLVAALPAGAVRARRPPGPGRGRGQGRRPGAGDRDRGGAGRRYPRPAHADQPRPASPTWSTAWRWSSRCRGGSARSSTSPAGRPPSASRSGTRSATGCGCAKAAGATPATTRLPSWWPASPASPSAAARPTACTSPGAATPCTGSSGCPPAWA